jgi:hypothetical protein
MRGHQSIIEARLNDYHPKSIFVHFFDEPPTYTEMSDPETLLHYGYIPELHIFKRDNLMALDFRCVYATNVHICADEPIASRIATAMKRFKPKTIYLPSGEKA